MRQLRHTLMPANALVHMLRSREVDLLTHTSTGSLHEAGQAGHGVHGQHMERPKLISELTRTYLNDVQVCGADVQGHCASACRGSRARFQCMTGG